MIRILFFLLLPSTLLLGFTPGKWSHTDSNVLGIQSGGPYKEVVRDPSGKVIYTATYEYNSEGKLVQENYFQSNGQADGYSTFEYKKGLLQEEKLHDANGKIVETRKFLYDGDSHLSKMKIFDNSGTLLLECSVLSMEGSLVHSAKLEWKNQKESQEFSLERDPSHKHAWIQKIYSTDRKLLGTTVYFFDAHGRLTKRTQSQGASERMSNLVYDSKNRLKSFSFHVKQGAEWQLEKTHQLIYKN